MLSKVGTEAKRPGATVCPKPPNCTSGNEPGRPMINLPLWVKVPVANTTLLTTILLV